MAYSPGDRVLVVSIGRQGEVDSVVGSGVYRVRVGTLVTVAREGDLRAAAAPGRKRRRSPEPAPSGGVRDAAAPAADGPVSTIDLHGLTAEEACRRVLAHINDAILAGTARVEVIHGIGTGRLKAAVTAELRGVPAIRRLAPHPTNRGVLIVFL